MDKEINNTMDIQNQQDAVLKANPLFRGLRSDQLRNILEMYPITCSRYDKGDFILRQGDTVRNVFFIGEGKLLCMKYHYDGDEQLLQVLRRGDMFGLESSSSRFQTSPCTLIADEDAFLYSFLYLDFINSVFMDPSVKIRVLQNATGIIADDSIKRMYKIDVLSKRILRDRLLTFFSIMHEKRKSPVIDIGMTQKQFASYLCVNRSVLSKELNMMRREGLIDFKGKQYILYEQSAKHCTENII